MLLTTIIVVVGLCVGGAENWKLENCPVTSKPVTEKPTTEEPITEKPKCCEWPISAVGVNSLNITINDFECDEPIRIDCARGAMPNDGVQKVGIAGFKDRSDTSKYTILAAMGSETTVQKTVICSSSSTKWYLEGLPEDEYSGFTCANLLNNGTWQYVFY